MCSFKAVTNDLKMRINFPEDMRRRVDEEWDMQPKGGRGPALYIKHFSCPQCGKKFRVAYKVAGA